MSDFQPVLVVSAAGCNCAIPLSSVVETMRPQPVRALAGTASPVLGVAIIRGSPTPVIDLRALLVAKSSPGEPKRFVTVRAGERHVAAAVDEVVGIHHLNPATIASLPPLLRDANTDVVAGIGARDAELLVVLRGAFLIPPAVWAALTADGAGA